MLDKVLFKLIGKNKKKLFLIVTLQVINFLFTLRASFLFCYVIFELVNNTNLTSLYYLLLIALFVLFKFLINRIINKIQNDISEEVTINLRKRLLNNFIYCIFIFIYIRCFNIFVFCSFNSSLNYFS